MKFKLLRGRHNEGGVTYIAGQNDVIETECDLNKLNPADPTAQKKFAKIHEESAVQTTATKTTPPGTNPGPDLPELEGMTVAELKKFAEEEEIELGGATRKEEIIASIRRAFA